MPKEVEAFVYNLAFHNRLNRYHTLENLEKGFTCIDSRLSKRLLARDTASAYSHSVRTKIELLEEDFLDFFPELCLHVREYVNEKNIRHWKC